MSDVKLKGRRAYEQRAWADAYESLAHANKATPLEAIDVERLAMAGSLSGHEESSIEAFGQLHQLCLDAGDALGAVRAAFWAGMRSFSIGEGARGSGWLATPSDCSIAKGRIAWSTVT